MMGGIFVVEGPSSILESISRNKKTSNIFSSPTRSIVVAAVPHGVPPACALPSSSSTTRPWNAAGAGAAGPGGANGGAGGGAAVSPLVRTDTRTKKRLMAAAKYSTFSQHVRSNPQSRQAVRKCIKTTLDCSVTFKPFPSIQSLQTKSSINEESAPSDILSPPVTAAAASMAIPPPPSSSSFSSSANIVTTAAIVPPPPPVILSTGPSLDSNASDFVSKKNLENT